LWSREKIHGKNLRKISQRRKRINNRNQVIKPKSNHINDYNKWKCPKHITPKSENTLWSAVIYAHTFLLLWGWGYIVAFTKVFTIYQIFHTWIHPLHHSWNYFDIYHFSIYIYVDTVFVPYTPWVHP
jgi:hypothetical protein